MPAARLALGYPFHAIRRLINVIGVGAAKDLMFSARRIGVGEALRIGLVQDVLKNDKLHRFVEDYAGRIARNAPLTLAAMKFISGEVMKDPGERGLAKSFQHEINLTWLWGTGERGEFRIEKGLSGGGISYGYRAVKKMRPDGTVEPGHREIIPEEAEIVRRIFNDYANGLSPRKNPQDINASGCGTRSVTGNRGAQRERTLLRQHWLRTHRRKLCGIQFSQLVGKRLSLLRRQLTSK